MRRILIIVGAVAMLAASASTAVAAKPSQADKREAQKECRAERGTTDATREAFEAKYRNFGACVSEKAREAKAERKQARREAKQACRDERAADRAAFKEKYGSNGLGRCVNQQAKAERAEEDAEDAEDAEQRVNAAQECDAERGETAESRKAFEDEYGTNHNKKNAFGKCVSEKAGDQG
jgi:FtsZ-interacting cell division protein ZipA